uniref:Uncharacterized protein n=1 Tax=Ralstonia solanacearum TaxID=305 RepID=A0A0S4UDV4_RALSL|nr:conserved exported protein of unknown function [Ralstonia solanacearum]
MIRWVKNALIGPMQKSTAIRLLGGSPAMAAKAIGVTTQALSQWPQSLPRRLEDRVVAAATRKYLASELGRLMAAAERGAVQERVLHVESPATDVRPAARATPPRQ